MNHYTRYEIHWLSKFITSENLFPNLIELSDTGRPTVNVEKFNFKKLQWPNCCHSTCVLATPAIIIMKEQRPSIYLFTAKLPFIQNNMKTSLVYFLLFR